MRPSRFPLPPKMYIALWDLWELQADYVDLEKDEF